MKAFACSMAVLLAFGLVLPAPVAMAEDYTYVGAAFGAWPNENNWRDHNNQINGYPDDVNDKAIVATGKSVLISLDDNITVGVIDIDGVIGIEGGGVLNLGHDTLDSTLDGRIEFRNCYLCSAGTLNIVHNITMSGSGTVLAGSNHGNLISANITTASGKTLTIGTVVLEGALTISARLTNNGTVKVAHPSDTLELTEGGTKDGAGDWVCEAGHIDLTGQFTVGGTGDWLISDDDADGNSLIVIGGNVSFDNHTGDFVIFGGVLDTYTDICTTGDLTFEDPDITDVETRIIIRHGNGATFNASSCP